MGQTRSSFEEKAAALEAAMRAAGYPVVRTAGTRTADEQARLYAQGRTAPGRRVTGKSGAPGDESLHQSASAFDFAFLDDRGQPSWAEEHPWEVLGTKAKELGLEWGGDWKTADRPHVQEPQGTRAPAAPANTNARRTPVPSAPKRKYSYADVVQAWKAEFPGQFDHFDNSDLIQAILAEQPEFDSLVDHATAGTESVPPPNLGGYERGPKRAAPVATTPPRAIRAPNYTDMAIEAGLSAVPPVLGGIIGSSAGPAGTAVGAALGGSAGEFLREMHQNWAGTRDDGLSLPNIVVQGGINAVPFAKYAGKAIGAVAPGLAKVVAPGVSRVAGNVVEGAVASTTSTAAEALIRDQRVPELGELGMAAGLGSAFGGAVGVGGEVVGAVKAARAVPDPALVEMHFNDLRTSPNRSAAAQDIYDLATTVGRSNPAEGAAMLQRLVGEAQALAQADLQTFAGQFVADFGKRADTLIQADQISEIEGFLSGLKARGAADATITQVQEILEEIRTTSAPRPFDQPSEVGWYSPIEPLPVPQELGLQRSPVGMRDGPPLATIAPTAPPTFAAQGVDATPAVQQGLVGRDDALFLQWISSDLGEMQYTKGSRMTGMTLQDTMLDATSAEAGRRAAYEPRAAGTPVYDAIWRLAGHTAKGQSGSRTVMATQIDNFLSGRARRPGKYALAAQKLGTLYRAAWVPETQKFDFSQVTDEQLVAAGWKGTRRELRQMTPATPLGFVAEGQPGDLLDKFGVRRAPDAQEAPPGPDGKYDDFPDEMAEAQKLVRGTSNADLLKLREDLQLGGGVEHFENPDDFNGAWYEVGPGMVDAELVRRGLGKYAQPDLLTEGPGTPGRLSVKGESAQAPLFEEPGTPSEQPALLPEVRTTERAQPLLMDEAELFRRTPEDAVPQPRRKPAAPGLFDDTGAVGDVAGKRNARNAAVREVAISDEDFQTLKSVVEQAGDREVAGLLLGDAQGNIRKVIPTANLAKNTAKQFEIGADVIARAQHLARQQGWELLGSFHSQPTGSAEPSRQDLRGNVSDLPMMILGVRGGSLRDVRIWQPGGGKQGGAAPWLEGVVRLGTEKPKPGTAVPAKTAAWMVDRIPRYTGAMGDSSAMADYLKAHKGEFSLEPWYVRAQQYLDEGNARMAAIEVQAATVQTHRAARETVRASPMKDAYRDALLTHIDQALQAGPQDPAGALFALYDGRTTWVDGVGRIVVSPEIPPALKGKGVVVGPGGILRPGKATVDLPIAQQSISMTVEAVNSVLERTAPGLILDDPTGASATRLMHQVAEQLIRRSPSQYGAELAWAEAMRREGMSEREINQQVAAHYTRSISDAGTLLGATGVWAKKHAHEIRRIEGITGASGDIDDVLLIGAGGRKLGRIGDLAPIDVYKDIIAPGRAWDRALLVNNLTRKQQGAFDTFEAASRGFMLSQWATAMRNAYSGTGRWGLETIADVGTAVGHTIGGRPSTAIKSLQRAADMLRYTPVLRPGGWVLPWHARQAQWEQVFTTTGFLAGFKGQDRLAIEQLIGSLPEEAAYFLGGTSMGEPHPHGQSKYRILNWMASPRVQNTLTMFNRASDFTQRADMTLINFRHELRRRDIDPHLMRQLPPADFEALVGGPEALQRMLHHSIAGALDFTYSGETISRGFGIDADGKHIGAFNTKLIQAINSVPGVRAGYPFPRFNFSAAPRLLWDYSGVNAIVETLNQVLLETQGTTVGKALRAGVVGTGYAIGGLPGGAIGGAIAGYGGVPLSLTGRTTGRFALGREARKLEQDRLPLLQSAYFDAQAQMGEQLQIVRALGREHTVRKRLIARAERRGLTQQAAEGRKLLDPLDRALEQAMDTFKTAEARAKDLHAEKQTRQLTIDQAKAVRAPETYAELWGRASAGMVAMLAPALLLRADQRDKGTKAMDLRYDIPGLGDTIIDTKPLFPVPQVLLVADIINDLDNETNWLGVKDDMRNGIPFTEALYARYEGKYTAATIGKELLNGFLSMSQKAGTSLAVIDELMALGERGVDTKRLGNALVSAVGNLLARVTIPFAPFKQLVAGVVPEEAKARIAEGVETDGLAGWTAPLMQYTANLPFVGSAIIPEKYNQLSGKPLATHMPWLRAMLGVTTRQWDRVVGEINMTGVPGDSVYLRATGDTELDRMVAEHYARAIAQHADTLIFANHYYNGRDEHGVYDEKLQLSPALKRDYLQAHVFPKLKKLAIGEAMIDVGWKRVAEAKEGAEQRRRRLRTERLYGLATEEQISFEKPSGPELPPALFDGLESAPGEVEEPEPGAAPEFAPPSGQSPQASSGPTAPRFEDDTATPALDRVLAAPAFLG